MEIIENKIPAATQTIKFWFEENDKWNEVEVVWPDGMFNLNYLHYYWRILNSFTKYNLNNKLKHTNQRILVTS